ERMTAAVRAIAVACANDPRVAAAVAGIHVEGPHVSPNDGPRGAHPLADVRPPDIALFDRLQAAADGRVRMVTLSPHWPESAAYVSALAARGIRVAIGHTDATRDEILGAVAAGATLSTHLGNGIAAMLPRHPNIIWTQLADDRLTATFIGDGHHLPVDTLKAMIRAKGPERAVLVSDVTALGGMPPGVYRQPIGGEVELSPDGRLGLRGTPYLAGAARSLADGVAVTAGVVGMDLALRMATLNPGAILGGDAGRPVVGRAASLVRFAWSPGDAHLGIDLVLADGRDVDLADGDGA
ncbi:MAG: N-acetylglucosamine-6-phosphate deacetylase, partial [Alsobacter sp.]